MLNKNMTNYKNYIMKFMNLIVTFIIKMKI